MNHLTKAGKVKAIVGATALAIIALAHTPSSVAYAQGVFTETETLNEFQNVAMSVAQKSVNIREEATTSSKILSQVSYHEFLTLLGCEPDGEVTSGSDNGLWYEVTTEDGVTGYVKADYFITNEEVQNYFLDENSLYATVESSAIGTLYESETEAEEEAEEVEEEEQEEEEEKSTTTVEEIKTPLLTAKVAHTNLSSAFPAETTTADEEEVEEEEEEDEEEKKDVLVVVTAGTYSVTTVLDAESVVLDMDGTSVQVDADTVEITTVPAEDALRAEIVEYACQFVGNPYVWGGTSLTKGADCSGFVMRIYEQFGYSLPRVSADQTKAGTRISVSDIQPGDLVFYGNPVHHVAMYIGDGKIVHAANSRSGIVIGDLNGPGTPVSAITMIG
jgi:cell wall-associated NlpC family hydrolase